MEKEWHKIISFNGSQANAFEELVCQIAMSEEQNDFVLFERVGTPDGGVECYWQLSNKTEWGWQAKYYESLNSLEWNSIKKSLFDAVDTHPLLTKYYICVPHNLSDGRRGKKTQKAIWDNYRNSWIKELSCQERNIDIILWNSSALFSKLISPKNIGIKLFFFEDIDIKESDLFLHLDAAIENLGPKYSPDLNFRLDYLPTVFSALSRDSEFKESFKFKIDTLLQQLNEVISDCRSFNETKNFEETLYIQYQEFIKILEETDFSPLNAIPVKLYLDKIEKINTIINSLKKEYFEIESKYQEQLKEEAKNKPKDNFHESHNKQKTSRQIDEIYKFSRASEELSYYFEGSILRCANEGIIFLKGNPGTGKSHLLADIAINKKKNGVPSIFLLGEHFTNQPPKVHIQQLLSPTHRLEDYLKSLESLGKAKQERILFIIDAINEGVGKHLWKNNIAGLIKEFTNFKWIGFVFSYRTTYEDVVIPENFTCPVITHNGFEGIEYEATKAFFEYYKIQQPAIPILNSEFSNPLFLKTFCVTLYKAGRTTVPEGYEGISRILEEYVSAVNNNVGTRLNYPYKKINLALKAVDELIKYQIEQDAYIIPWDVAFSLIEPLLKTYSNSSGLLEELIKEGLFIEDYFYDRKAKKYEQHGVVFNYERFNEHLKALYLLSNYSNVNALKKGFTSKGSLRKLLFDEHGFNNSNTGLLNSFSIIIPEKFNVELYEIFNSKENYVKTYIFNAFLQSLIWRKSSTIKPNTWNYTKKFLVDDNSIVDFFNHILLLSPNPENCYNADFVHTLLKGKKVAERDFLWSVIIDKLWNWHERNSVKRIIDWCWSEDNKSYVKDESIFLLGKILAWLFTNSNRTIRDKATKAFATLFIGRTHLLQKIIEEFKAVNDPYVLERVIAGVYGAITHTSDIKASVFVAQYLYNEFYKERKPPLNVLTRDYAKGIIEYVLSQGGVLEYRKTHLYPPFDYPFPEDIPDEEWVKSLEIKKEGQYTEGERSQFKITHSVLTWDFARYILGTNYGNSLPFTDYPTKSREAYEVLNKTLRGYNKQYLKMYVNAHTMLNETSELGKKLRRVFSGDKLKEQLDLSEDIKITAHNFLKGRFTEEQWKLFEECQAFIDSGFETKKYHKKRFDVKIVQRYILKRVFDLGWSMKYFGAYDSKVDDNYRKVDKSERIGKKYQWIAYYEVMALLSDNYDFLERFSENSEPYLGTWQHNFRNIDPTVILKEGKAENEEHSNEWWIKEVFSNWSEGRETWLKRFDDVPSLEKLVVIKDDCNEEWYLLYDRVVWQSSKPIGKERYNAGRKEVWVDLNAFLIDKKNISSLINTASKKLIWLHDEIPENLDYHNIFLGELYHSDSYIKQTNDSYEKYPFTSINFGNKGIPVIRTVEDYGFSKEYDLSGSKVNIYKPSKFLFELLEARPGKEDAFIYDKYGKTIGYDAGAHLKQSKRCFLLNKRTLDDCLIKNNLELIWVYCGEKEDIGPNVDYVYRMLFSGVLACVSNKFQNKFHFREET